MADKIDRFEEQYSDGSIIFCEFEPGDSFYYIKSGSVKLVKVIEKKESIIDILKPGTFVGEMSVIESNPRSATAIAVGELSLIKFPAENFQEIILQNSHFLIRLIKTFANRIFIQQQRIKIFSYKAPIVRILAFLNSLKVPGKTNEGKSCFIINSSSADVSKWVGLSVEECNTVLKGLVQRKVINVLKDSIIIYDDALIKREFSLYSSNDK